MKFPSLPFASTLIEPFSRNGSDCSELDTTNEPAAHSSVTTPEEPQPVEASNQGTWAIFSSTFLTIFLAEMGDKTQLATLLISAESQSPWIVFVGAAGALITTSLLGVLVGQWLAKRLSPKNLDMAAGSLLLFIAVMLLWDVVQMGS